MADNLLSLHLKEEWRMMTSYFSSEKLFLLFPLVLVGIGFFTASLIPVVKTAFNMKELVIAFHFLLMVYGLLVGGFGFFADEVAERWFRDVTLLIHMHRVLPISFRKIFVWFYLKDMVYYLFLTLFPLYVGAFLSFTIPVIPFVRVVVSSVLSFLIGVSVSFLVSSLYVRNRLSLLGVALAAGFMYFQFSYRNFPPVAFLVNRDVVQLIYSLGIVVTFSVISLAITNPVTKSVSKPVSKTQLFSRVDPLLAKEIIDLKRSGTWQIIITSYTFPLIFLYGIFYFSGRLFHFDLNIPLIFYAVFIGYLSTLVYSWLNNIDTPSTMVTLPVTVSQLIKRKIKLFFVLSFAVSILYLVILGYILSDLNILWLSLICMGSTTFYVSAVTAWLCGLYPNTKLFDGSVLIKYLTAILPVLIVLSILSLMQFYLGIVLISVVVLVLSFLVYQNLGKKYEDVYLS